MYLLSTTAFLLTFYFYFMTTNTLPLAKKVQPKLTYHTDEVHRCIARFLSSVDPETVIESLGFVTSDFMGKTDIDDECRQEVASSINYLILFLHSVEKRFNALEAMQKEVANA